MKAPRLAERLSERAAANAARVDVHPAKAAATRAESATPDLPSPPPVTTGPRRRVRPLVENADLTRRLEALRLPVEHEGLARVLSEVEEALAGRPLQSLDAAARAALAARVRGALVKAAPGVRRLQRELAQAARELRGARVGSGLRIATVETKEGVWLFFHTDVATDAVIVGESFVAARTGVAVPPAPLPAQAGLRGRPRWRVGDTVVDVRPDVVPGAPRASGLADDALDEGAELVLEEYARAEDVASAAAPTTRRPVRVEGDLTPAERATEGGGIESIEVRAPAPGGPPPGAAAWDLETTIRGRVRPELPTSEAIEARDRRAMDALLPPAGKLGDRRYRGWARVHAWGRVLGDMTLAGLAYAPHKAFNLLQLGTVEGFLRAEAKRLGSNLRTGTELTVQVRVQMRTVGGHPRPFLRSAEYTATLEDGKKVVATLTVDERGRVAFGVR